MHIIGNPGTGKSTLLLQMAIEDMKQGNGVALTVQSGNISFGSHHEMAPFSIDKVPTKSGMSVLDFDIFKCDFDAKGDSKILAL